MSALPGWATLDPSSLGSNPEPHSVSNLVGGKWSSSNTSLIIPNPMDKHAPPVCTVPDTQGSELTPFIESMKAVPKSGVHNRKSLKVFIVLSLRSKTHNTSRSSTQKQ
jgi:1-pyrroline-5-carboxylate dehydrogenase